MNTTTSSSQASNLTDTDPESSLSTRPLLRPAQGRMLAGVAAGIARYLGADVIVVRIVLAVLAVVGGVGVPLYLAGWLLIPEEGSGQSIASELIQSLSARSR